MKLIVHFISGFVLLFASIILFSCHLEDFNMNKLANPVDIIPDVYAPLVYGTFTVANLVPPPKPEDSFQIPTDGIELPLVVSKSGTSFSSAAIDSVYLITHFSNNTPCDIEFELSFLSSPTGSAIGNPFSSGIIPANTPDFAVLPFFGLDRTDQDILQSATFIKLNFRLFPSATARTYGDVKAASFSFKISFRAPVNLQKL